MALPWISPAAFLLTRLRMCHDGSLHADAHVRAFGIVEQDDALQFLPALLSRGILSVPSLSDTR